MSSFATKKIAIIAGAGPAGLTAALELLRRSNITPIVIEADTQVGGISKTVNYHGNRMDLGGHRFFSKSDWVMRWWQEILPVAVEDRGLEGLLPINYQRRSSTVRLEPQSEQQHGDAVMLVRRRLSRIFYRRRFYDYPLALNANSLRNLGPVEAMRIGLSYSRSQLIRTKPENTLRDFLVNRFGERLYTTFFKAYTEKVWGVPCENISAEWGAQRIRGISVAKALAHAIAQPFRKLSDIRQKHIENSFIEQFLYPKFGPGQMWEEVSRRVEERGGQVNLGRRVTGIWRRDHKILGVQVTDSAGAVERLSCDYLISTMPVRDLVGFLQPGDAEIQRVADGLPYRDFITAGLLLRRMNASSRANKRNLGNGMPPDNWIYVQEPDVRMGRIQVFNNWSPAMVADPDTIWLGLEYFCREGDELWSLNKGQFTDFAAKELEQMGLANRRDVIDGTLVRVPKAYPAYFGVYAEFAKIRGYLDSYSNLYPIGRNGMHRYNNQDHSMLAADAAVTSIIGDGDKSDIWRVNADDDYHEETRD